MKKRYWIREKKKEYSINSYSIFSKAWNDLNVNQIRLYLIGFTNNIVI